MSILLLLHFVLPILVVNKNFKNKIANKYDKIAFLPDANMNSSVH